MALQLDGIAGELRDEIGLDDLRKRVLSGPSLSVQPGPPRLGAVAVCYFTRTDPSSAERGLTELTQRALPSRGQFEPSFEIDERAALC
jgi:hypothetical protein